MVRNYRGINDDIRIAIKYAREKLIEKGRDAQTSRYPTSLIEAIEKDLDSLKKLEGAIKKRT